MAPQFRRLRREDRFSDADQLFDELFRLCAEGEFNSFFGTEEIGDGRKVASLHSREKQCGTAALDYATMNLGDFEIRIDFRFDGNQMIFATEKIEEGA